MVVVYASFGVYPLFLPLAIKAFGGPGGYLSLAIIAFDTFQSIVPKYYYRLGKWNLRSLASLFKEVTVFKGKRCLPFAKCKQNCCSVEFGHETPPNSHLNITMDFGGFFPLVSFFQGKSPPKIHQTNPPRNVPGNLFGNIPIGFLQQPFLEKL